MAKAKDEKTETQETIQKRMDDAVKRFLSTPPETHEEMLDRKHRFGEIKPKKRGRRSPS
jgi:hypothetical protein